MVDAGASFLGNRDNAESPRPTGAARSSDNDAARSAVVTSAQDYAAFAAGSPHAPAQSPAWVAGWTAHSGLDCAIVTIHAETGLRITLPLEIVRRGPFRVARFMGGSHANGNFPAFSAPAGASGVRHGDIVTAVREARLDVDLVHLERQVETLSGVTNPLLPLATGRSPNVALAVDLAGGFDVLLGRASGKRKRKKHRSQTRKFEAAGGFRRIEAKTAEEIDRLLDVFFAMKRERFRKMGIHDVFAAAGVQAFFHGIFSGALTGSPPQFVLHGLEVGGVLRAITGSSRCGDRLICEFGAIAEDDLAHASPGEFLFFENIREACEAGLSVYDFSVGDELYKRLWCDTETTHFDVAIPVSAKGRLFSAALRVESALKRLVKSNRFIWSLTKRLRKQAAPQTASTDED